MACLYINYREPGGQGVNWHCACIPTTINHSYYIFELGFNLQKRCGTNPRTPWLAADEEIRAQLRPVCQAIEKFLVGESKRRDAPGEDVKDKERERFRPDYTRSPLAENPIVSDTCIFPDGVNPHELGIDDLKRYLGAAFKVFGLQFFEKFERDGYDILNENRSGNLMLALRWGSKNSSYLETTCASIQKTQENPECWEITTTIPVGKRNDWHFFFEAVKAEFGFAQRAYIGERIVDIATPTYFKSGEDLQSMSPGDLLARLNEALGDNLKGKGYHFKDTSASAGRRAAICEDPSGPERIEALWLLQNDSSRKVSHYGYVALHPGDERSGRGWTTMGSRSLSFSASASSFKEIGPFIKQLTAALSSSPKKAGQRASATASPEAPRPTVSVENLFSDPGKLQTVQIQALAGYLNQILGSIGVTDYEFSLNNGAMIGTREALWLISNKSQNNESYGRVDVHGTIGKRQYYHHSNHFPWITGSPIVRFIEQLTKALDQKTSITSSALKPADPATPPKKQTMSREAFLRSLSRGR
jgi:hypothetical protein